MRAGGPVARETSSVRFNVEHRVRFLLSRRRRRRRICRIAVFRLVFSKFSFIPRPTTTCESKIHDKNIMDCIDINDFETYCEFSRN